MQPRALMGAWGWKQQVNYGLFFAVKGGIENCKLLAGLWRVVITAGEKAIEAAIVSILGKKGCDFVIGKVESMRILFVRGTFDTFRGNCNRKRRRS